MKGVGIERSGSDIHRRIACALKIRSPYELKFKEAAFQTVSDELPGYY